MRGKSKKTSLRKPKKSIKKKTSRRGRRVQAGGAVFVERLVKTISVEVDKFDDPIMNFPPITNLQDLKEANNRVRGDDDKKEIEELIDFMMKARIKLGQLCQLKAKIDPTSHRITLYRTTNNTFFANTEKTLTLTNVHYDEYTGQQRYEKKIDVSHAGGESLRIYFIFN